MDSTPDAGGKVLTHGEHRDEALKLARQASEIETMCDTPPPDFGDEDAFDSWAARERSNRRAAKVARDRAQWHATMAVYEALVLPGYGSSVGEQLEHEREGGTR